MEAEIKVFGFGIYCGYRSVKNMKTRLIIDGNAVYEIDEECEACQQKNQKKQESQREQCKKNFSGERDKESREF